MEGGDIDDKLFNKTGTMVPGNLGSRQFTLVYQKIEKS